MGDTEALLRALKDEDSHVRCRAAIALGEAHDMRAVEPLIALLGDDWMHVREAAASALGEIGDIRAVPRLCSILSGYSDGRAAADALVKIGPPAIDGVAAVLLDKPDIVDAREMAARVLGLIGDPRAVGALITALHSPVGFRSSCTPADALVAFGDQAVESLAGVLRDGDLVAADVLMRIGTTQALEEVVDCLNSVNQDVRSAAAHALARAGDMRAAPQLVVELRSPAAWRRRYAAELLSDVCGEHAIEALVAALRDNDADVKTAAGKAIGRALDAGVRTPMEVVPPLILLLGDQDQGVRRVSRQALSAADAAAVELLIATLNDPNPYIRRGAAEALGTLGDARAAEPLSGLFDDRDWNTRNAARTAFAKLGEDQGRSRGRS